MADYFNIVNELLNSSSAPFARIRNAREAQRQLTNHTEDLTQSDAELLSKSIKGAKQNAWTTGLISGAEGILDATGLLLDTAKETSMTPYDNRLEAMDGYGTTTYNNNAVLTNYLNRTPRFDMDLNKINPSVEQSVGKSLTGGLSAAKTAFELTGLPWVSAGVGLVGAAATALADNYARQSNAVNVSIRNNEQDRLQGIASRSLQSGTDQTRDTMYGSMYSHRRDNGGEIQRTPSDINMFAKRIIDRKNENDVTRSANIIRIRKNGGLCLRIKR